MAQDPPRHDGPRTSEDLFHHLVDAVTDYAIFRLDSDGRVLTWNAGARSIKGYSADEIIGRHISTFYPPEDVAAGKVKRILDTVDREGRYEEEGWRVRKGGSRFWANVIITALRDHQHRITGYAKVTRDLTHRKEAEEKTRRSEERFRLLVEAVEDYAIYMLDADGHVSTWNSGARRLKGFHASEVIGKTFALFFTDEDVASGKPAKELALAREHGRFEDEGWRVRKDGSRFWAGVVVTPVRNETGEIIGFAKVTRDLTRWREAEETARSLFREQVARSAAENIADRAVEANRVKDEFLATVSHELRTPLNAIVGWIRILRRETLSPAASRAVDIIERNAHAQTHLVDDILDVSRVIMGKLRIETEPLELVGVVRSAIDVVAPSAVARGVVIRLHAPTTIEMIGDAARLQQVIWNLLSNAVKFTDAGGSIDVETRRTENELSLCVRDTGRGIDAAFLPFVFDRFKQADSSTTRALGGLGLGLAVVRHIVELHGGSVTAESDGIGEGSTFEVRLPLRANVRESTTPRAAGGTTGVLANSSESAVPSPDDGSLGGVELLVVDDDVDARDLLAEILCAAGAAVHTASSAREGLSIVRARRPRAVVSDIGMPEEDGYTFMRQVRALGPEGGGDLHAIALTAYTRPEDREKALASGFSAHLPKPLNAEELVRTLARLLRRDPAHPRMR